MNEQTDFGTGGWVKVEFYAQAPALQRVTGVDLPEIATKLCDAFGFVKVAAVSVVTHEGNIP